MLALFRALLGVASSADRWLVDEHVSDACLSRLWEMERTEARSVAKGDSSRVVSVRRWPRFSVAARRCVA